MPAYSAHAIRVMNSAHFVPQFTIKIDNAELPANFLHHVSSLRVTREPGTLDHIGLTLANPYPSLPWTHSDDADVFKEGRAIVVELGYFGEKLVTVFDGEIIKISPTFPEGGEPTVDVEGYSRLHWLKGTSRTRTFVKMTDKQIAERVAKDIKLTPECGNTTGEHPYVVQNNQTDLAFLMDRASRIGFTVRVVGRTLHFDDNEPKQDHPCTLVWGGLSAMRGSKELPLLSFNPGLNVMSQFSEVEVRGYDPKAKKAITGVATAKDLKLTVGGAAAGGKVQSGPSAAEAAFGRSKREVIANNKVSSAEEAKRLALAILDEHARRFVEGTGSTIGLPTLEPGTRVQLAGLGKRFSCGYFVSQVTHTLDAGGFRTSFQVRGNAIHE